MRKSNTTIIFSPSDLTAYLESPFTSWMDRCHLEHPQIFKQDEADESEEFIQEKGNTHEKDVLEILRKEFGLICEIPGKGDFAIRSKATIKAMQAGEKVIYQAALHKDQFAGYADFLIRVNGKSKLGDFHYEAWDSKLARSTKPYFVIQLLCYSEMLELIQGVFPQTITVVLGTLEHKILKTQDFKEYYHAIKERFLDFHNVFDHTKQPIPQKGEVIRRWNDEATKVIEATDHLSQVANIRSVQIQKLEDAGIRTLTDLANSIELKVPNMDSGTFQKLKKQAELQLKSKGQPKPHFELIANSDNESKGLYTLPPFSKGDIYFDMEGYPLYDDQGLEYLFGLIVHEDKNDKFIDFWAHNRVQEKKAFEDFIDYVYARFQKYPDLHIYHYAAYEVTATRRLSTQHATREYEVDQILRANLFVDLYKVVTQSLVVGEPSYSIKYIEHLYMDKRFGDVTNAGASLVEYAKYLNQPDGADWNSSKILKSIRDYNEDDCKSTVLLTDWLRNQQTENKIPYLGALSEDDEIEEPKEKSDAEKLAYSILEPLSKKETLTEDERVMKLLAELLQFHRREKKQYYWKYFEWIKSTHFELIDDSECIGAIQKIGTPTPVKKSFECEYSFDPNQDIKFSAGDTVKVFSDQDHISNCDITELDKNTGKLNIKLGPKGMELFNHSFPEMASILPSDPVDSTPIETSIYETVNEVALDPNLSNLQPALRDFLFRTSPRSKNLKTSTSVKLTDALELENSTLCIQGPPGAGKTYSGSNLIVELLARGKKIAILSNSHNAILNLMLAVISKAPNAKCYKTGGDKEKLREQGIQQIESKNIVSVPCATNGSVLIGSTAWGLSRPEVKDHFDYLFVDEAGQVALANFVAVARCAKNIVLMGDQMQLEQPTQGSHPGESGESCLTYLIQEHSTIPPHLGVFLDQSHRMRPSVCQFVSDYFYDSRLKSDAKTITREIVIQSGLKLITQSEGILFVPETRGNHSQSNPDEVETILKIIAELKTCSFKDASNTRSIIGNDILVVAPYNLQVNLLKSNLPVGAAVGTVDKFQGGEAPVVILSMTSSSLENASRGLEFLFSPNRINVAISRAKCLAIVVANPNLKMTDASSIEKMKLVNLFCGLAR